MVTVNPTVGVLHRGSTLVVAVEDLTGDFHGGPDGLIVRFTGRLVGKRSYWCAPGVEVALTFLAAPKRRKGPRLYCPRLSITSIRDDRIELRGKHPLSFEPGYAGPIPPEA